MIHQLSLVSVMPRMKDCIQECEDCSSMCVNTIAYCMQQGGKLADVDVTRLLLDCAQMCRTTADFMLRGSALHEKVCELCADVCQRCAVVCARFTSDTQMKASADVCTQCAKACIETIEARSAA